MTAEFRVVTDAEDLIKVMVVRGIVFCAEQRISYAIERDAHDAVATHVLGEVAGEPVAAGRIIDGDDRAVIGRLAVRSPYRGRGLGHALLDFLLETASQRGHRCFELHAQAHLEAFYAAHGFRPVGARFYEADIEHQLMVRDDAATMYAPA